jgi:hypothetical protein
MFNITLPNQKMPERFEAGQFPVYGTGGNAIFHHVDHP